MSKMKKIKKARFALPSLVTLGSVFCSFLSMSYAFLAQSQTGDARLTSILYAALAIIGSTIFDLFDGKVARLTHTSTKFGMELDSLADGVSFGVTPAVLMYGFALNQLGLFGVVACFLYVAGTLVRLARFNIEAPDEGVQTFFKGIPAPGGAACVVAIVLACLDIQFTEFSQFELNTLAGLTIAIGLLMVSNVKYKTLKGKKTKADYVYIALGLLLFGVTWIVKTPSIAFFCLVCYFVVYGMLYSIYYNLKYGEGRRRRRELPEESESSDAKSEEKTEDKVDAKSEEKAEDKVDAKSEEKAEDKVDAKSEEKAEDKVDAKSEEKAEDK